MNSIRWRAILSALIIVAGLAYALPNIPSIGNSGLGNILPSDRINLGLDLKGGMNLTLGVDLETAVKNNLTTAGQDIADRAAKENIVIVKPRVNNDGKLEIILPNKDQAPQLKKLFADNFQDLAISGPQERDGNQIYLLELNSQARNYLEELTMDQVVRTIRNRIDQFGVAEPDIRRQSGNQVQVQLPGLTDAERAIQIVGQTAHLEFRLVQEGVDPNALMMPPGVTVFPMVDKRGETGRTVNIALGSEPLMGGTDITNARPAFDEHSQPYVAMEFNSRGASQFERITGENIKKAMAIVLDGVVYSAPVIQARIAGGKASISGNFTVEEAQDLALVLRAGSLPAPVTVLEERTVGPSLGQESINSGIMAAIIGALAVIVVMPLYYGMSGFIADAMLVVTMSLLMAGMSAFGATLTLPGIAGIVLTIGMAVDANVLIYERIREEMRNGLSPGEAVKVGFDRATVSITDSNLTTIIAAAVLYQFGTGPIRGFAVTLSLGVIASLFTAIFVSRVVFEVWMNRNNGSSISI